MNNKIMKNMIDLIMFKKSKEKNHLKNLVAIAKMDGVVTKEEFNYLVSVGEKTGVSVSEIKKMIDKDPKNKIKKPENLDLGFEHLYELAQMTAIDGVIDEKEIDFCVDFANKLGFNKTTSAIVVRRVFGLMEQNKTKEEIIQVLKEHLLF